MGKCTEQTVLKVYEKSFNFFSHRGNANLNCIEIIFSQKWLSLRKGTTTGTNQRVTGTFVQCSWQGKLVEPLGKSTWRLLSRLKIELTMVQLYLLFLLFYTKVSKHGIEMLCVHVYLRSSHNSWDTGTSLKACQQMMSENMWHSYTGILLNRKEKKMSLEENG